MALVHLLPRRFPRHFAAPALLLLLASSALGACGGPRPPASPPAATPTVDWLAWQTALDVTHPLVGKVWDVKHARFVSSDDVYATIARADFVVLGEKHDNPDHHALQARALAAIVARGQRPAVAFEMIDADAQPTVDAFAASTDAGADGFGPAVDWEKRGWPKYAWYAPIARVAFDAHLPIVAANLPRAELRGIVHGEADALSEANVKRLGLDRPLPQAQAAELYDELKASHCGMLPEPMLEPMALAQRARDAQMGARMLAAAQGRPAVLVAGNGHARTDRGVPAWLTAHVPGARVVSIGFLEVDHAKSAPEAAPYDFVWYTPRATDEDPCLKMRQLHR